MQSFFKKWVLRIHSFLTANQKDVYKVCIAIAALAIVVQFSTIAGVLFLKTDSRAVIATVDDDSAAGIGNAEKTYLINDNGTRVYGPVYYRITSILRNFGINEFADGYTSQEHRERSIYFHLMLVNLIGIYLGGFFLMRLLTSRLDFQLLGTWALTGAFLANEMRSLLLFMGKPDHLFTAFVTLALLWTWKWLKAGTEPNFQSNEFRWMTFSWALAMSTKLTAVFFLPGLMLLFFSKSARVWFKNFKPFVIGMILFYFLVGFPQNFDFWRNLDYLIHQNSQASPVSFEFFRDQWLRLFVQDFKLPLLMLLILILFLGDTRKEEGTSWKLIGKFSLPFLFGTLWLISKQTRAPFQWYTFPFTNAGLILFCLFCLKALSLLPVKWNEKWNQVKQHIYYPAFAFLILPVFVNPLPLQVWKSNSLNSSCRKEARDFQVVVNEKAGKGQIILADPYVPYSREFHDKTILMSYEMTPDKIETLHPKYIALKRSYYMIYLPKSEGGAETPVTHIQDLEQTRNFYRIFFQKSEGKDPGGHTWKKIYEDACTFELWEKVD
jgi:hypothetical protein